MAGQASGAAGDGRSRSLCVWAGPKQPAAAAAVAVMHVDSYDRALLCAHASSGPAALSAVGVGGSVPQCGASAGGGRQSSHYETLLGVQLAAWLG